jgi:hypothetical protein
VKRRGREEKGGKEKKRQEKGRKGRKVNKRKGKGRKKKKGKRNILTIFIISLDPLHPRVHATIAACEQGNIYGAP